jgi:hypothetical protein
LIELGWSDRFKKGVPDIIKQVQTLKRKRKKRKEKKTMMNMKNKQKGTF